MNKFPDYSDYIFASYIVPVMSSDGIKTIITGYTKLGPFNVDAVGFQARLIGLWFLTMALIIMYFILYKIPKSIDKEKVKRILKLFFNSGFFILWISCIISFVTSNFLPYGNLLFVSVLIICFFFQKLFNKKVIQIYNEQEIIE